MITSFGLVTLDDLNPVRATNNEIDPTALMLCHSVMIQTWWQNTGNIYICDRQAADKTTGAGVIAVLPPPSANSYPAFTDTITGAIAGINLERIWLVADVKGESALVTGDIP